MRGEGGGMNKLIENLTVRSKSQKHLVILRPMVIGHQGCIFFILQKYEVFVGRGKKL